MALFASQRPALRKCQSFSDTFDTFSESWCSVHYSPQRATTFIDPPLPLQSPEPVHQRVSTWLQGQQHSNAAAAQPAVVPALHRRRSQSQVSLADFLRCVGPYRPSFLNRQTPGKEKVERRQKQQKEEEETVAEGRVKEVGHVAAGTTTSDAEFLSHVLSHFVAFQPLDFTRTAAALPAMDQTDVPLTPQDSFSPPGGGGLWAYLASALGELTRDVTFIQ